MTTIDDLNVRQELRKALEELELSEPLVAKERAELKEKHDSIKSKIWAIKHLLGIPE